MNLLLVALLPLAVALDSSGPSVAPADSDLKPLAARFEEWRSAQEGGQGLQEARDSLLGELAKLTQAGKKSSPATAFDIGRAFWLSRGYEKQKVRSGKVTKETSPAGSFQGGDLHYAYRIPRKYNPAKQSYPLILAIPDVDESPADHIRTYWDSSAVRDGAIVISPQMPKQRDEWDQLMVNGRPGGLCNVLTALRLAEERFAIDSNRVYVTGRGKSIPAAMAAGNYSPHRFAGIVTRSGDLGDLGPENFRNLPTLIGGGGARARAFEESAKALGITNCERVVSLKEEAVWTWLTDHQRSPFPDKTTVVVGKPFPTRVGWLQVAPIATTAQATASLDRETNTITIDGAGISLATIYLSPAMLDLEKEITVRCNGVEQAVRLDSSPSTLLDLLQAGTSDAGCVYSHRMVVDMRADAPAPVADSAAPTDTDFERYSQAAEGDVAKLWELHLWSQRTAREGRSLGILKRLLALDGDHREAGEALDRQLQGVSSLSSADRKRLGRGWLKQDTQWISPEDRPQVEGGKWFVNGEWMGLRRANEHHADIGSMWLIPGERIRLHSTVNRQTSLAARVHMERALLDVAKVFGTEPSLPLDVAMLRDEEQYDRFAFGAPDGRRRSTHAGRLHVVHSAYFAESWFSVERGKRAFKGMGVCYWDPYIPGGDAYGLHSARLAAGFSFVEALDPSPKAVRGAVARGVGDDYYGAYLQEKRFPAWLRFGAAVYGERYFVDGTVAAGGDPHWARTWSLGSLKQRGGLRPLDEVFAFAVDPEDREDGLKLYLEAGLLVAFILDGDCAPVLEEHARFKRTLAAGRLKRSHLRDLESVLMENKTQLMKFAGL